MDYRRRLVSAAAAAASSSSANELQPVASTSYDSNVIDDSEDVVRITPFPQTSDTSSSVVFYRPSAVADDVVPSWSRYSNEDDDEDDDPPPTTTTPENDILNAGYSLSFDKKKGVVSVDRLFCRDAIKIRPLFGHDQDIISVEPYPPRSPSPPSEPAPPNQQHSEQSRIIPRELEEDLVFSIRTRRMAERSTLVNLTTNRWKRMDMMPAPGSGGMVMFDSLQQPQELQPMYQQHPLLTKRTQQLTANLPPKNNRGRRKKSSRSSSRSSKAGRVLLPTSVLKHKLAPILEMSERLKCAGVVPDQCPDGEELEKPPDTSNE